MLTWDIGDGVVSLMKTVASKFPNPSVSADEITHFTGRFASLEDELKACSVPGPSGSTPDCTTVAGKPTYIAQLAPSSPNTDPYTVIHQFRHLQAVLAMSSHRLPQVNSMAQDPAAPRQYLTCRQLVPPAMASRQLLFWLPLSWLLYSKPADTTIGFVFSLEHT